MTAIANVSRRELLGGLAVGSGLVLGLQLGLGPVLQAAETPNFAPNAFVSIDAGGEVTIVAHRAEMGTGIKTDLPLVLADELEADWNSRQGRPGAGRSEIHRPEHRRVAQHLAIL